MGRESRLSMIDTLSEYYFACLLITMQFFFWLYYSLIVGDLGKVIFLAPGQGGITSSRICECGFRIAGRPCVYLNDFPIYEVVTFVVTPRAGVYWSIS